MNMEDKVKKVGLMKENVVRMCKQLNAESSLLYLFTLQWKDLEEYIDGVQKGIEGRYQEVKVLEREVEGRLKDVELKEGEISSVKRKMGECEASLSKLLEELNSKEGQVKDASKHQIEIASKKEGVALSEGKIERFLKILALKEQEFEAICESQKRLHTEVESREKYLEGVDNKIRKLEKELQLKERQYASIQISIGQCNQELDLKRKELAEIDVSMRECSDELESKQKELKLVEESTSKLLKELKMKENSIHSLESSEYFLEPRSRKSLQFLSWEHLEKHDGVSTEFFSTLKASTDPAQFALDALQGFSRINSPNEDERVDIRAIIKCLLLEHLMSTMPQVRSALQKDAMTLAVEWKEKMEILLEHYSLTVLAFLQLVAAYRFSSAYPAKELRDLLNLVSGYRNINQLRQALGLMEESPVAVPNQSTLASSTQAFSTPDGPNSSQSYSQSPQAGKRTKELAKKRRCDFYML